MLKLLLPAFALIAVSVAQPDTAWLFTYPASEYGESQPLAAFFDDTGDVYVAGWSEKKPEHPDVLLLKIDSLGRLVWDRTYPDVIAVGAARDTAGNIYVTGSSTDTSEGWLYTMKYTPNGDLLWAKNYTEPYRRFRSMGSIAIDDSQNVYACGGGESASCGIVRVLKYRPDGLLANVMSYTLSKNMSADGGWFHILKDGGTYLVLCRMLVVRLSRQGQVLWEKNCKDTNSAWEPLRWSELDEKASIYLTGDVDDHSRVLKIDSSGSIVWVREFNSPEKNRDQLLFLLQRKGDTYLAGWVMKDKVSTDQTRIIVARTDSLGNELWASEWGGADIAYPGYGSNWYEPEARPDYCSMNVDDSGNVYVTGWFGYSCSRSYCFGAAMLKYDARGSRVWVRKLPEQPREWWNGAIVGLDKKGALYDIGVERDSLPPYGIYVLKYRTR